MATSTDWAIPQQAKLKYTQLFNLHDRSRSGFLSGLQCRDILMQSGLTRNILAEIWNLSDIDGDGQLTREEFILAMHLTNQVRLGNQLPAELPADLIPPSYRKTRSISATSVHSAASAASSTTSAGAVGTSSNLICNNDDQLSQKSTEAIGTSSILNPNSFEDKRRENFEKGRAELERRRLKMIESQISVLSEQLISWKKQVAEAKAKIDSMRSDRDTKAGLITSLEAQLQTVRDRKAFLQHEEQNLIAIAKDLNLVNSAHSIELDQQACQTKEESIKQMKEKLIELQKEKESKANELASATKLLDDSKLELKTNLEEANKVYQRYKEKLTKANVMREKFIEENKSKPIDLHAAWDAAPTDLASKTLDLPNATSNDAFGAPADDPWVSPATTTNKSISSAIEDPYAFSHPDKEFQDNRKSENNNQTDFTGARDYSAFAELAQKPAQVIDQESASHKAPEPTASRKRYHALYAFDARNPDELTINPGDIIIGSDVVCEPGWLSGEINGKCGLFPEAYVELLPEEPQSDSVLGTSKSALVSPLTVSVDPTASETASSFVDHSKTIIKYRVLYAFEARNPDELTINPGDIITGTEGQHEPGWLMGELGGQRGLFPEAYVERLAAEALTSASEKTTEPSVGKSRGKKAEVATVIANYRALGQEQLNLEKGQLVLIRRKMDSGWWEGEVQIKEKSELDHLIGELIKSEWDYVNDLFLFRDTYVTPLAEAFDNKYLVNNWNQLIHVHETSLVDLSIKMEENKKNTSDADRKRIVFANFQSLLDLVPDLYIEFCSRQNEAMHYLSAKMASDIRFKQLINESQRNLRMLAERQLARNDDNDQLDCTVRNANLPLVSFILKPMQRITKYGLLFERILNLLDEKSSEQIERLHKTAQKLCKKVNEACRAKQDEQENAQKLYWCQNHIEQTSDRQSSFSSDGNLDLQQLDSSVSPNASSHNKSSGDRTVLNEHIEFDSPTCFQGPRKFVKVSTLIKIRSGRELVAFLFNDLLILTQIKGGPSLRLIDDLFKSDRARQAYYKVYKTPILLADLQVQELDELEEQQLQTQLSSIMMCRPSLSSITSTSTISASTCEPGSTVIAFVDHQRGNSYNLLASSSADRDEWKRLLVELSTQARETRMLKISSTMITKPLRMDESVGRIFVTVLALTSQQSNQFQRTRSSFHLTHSNSVAGGDRSRSLNPSPKTPERVCVRLQMRRYIRPGPSSGIVDNAKPIEVVQLIDEYKTKTANLEARNEFDQDTDKRSVLFDNESAQFLISDKQIDFTIENSDYLELEVMTDFRYRDNYSLARRRLSIDDLIGRENPKPIIDFFENNFSRRSLRGIDRSTQALIPDRPIDMTFKLKSTGSHSNYPRTTSLRRSMMLSHSAGDTSMTSSGISRTGDDSVQTRKITVKLRLHLQLFTQNDV